jgi:hypothetical protein
VSFRRDPLDRRYPERLTAASAVSLVLHALLALLLFTVLVSSSREGATENVSGGEVVTLERRAPVQVAKETAAAAAIPVPHVDRIAPVRHAPLAQPVHQQPPPQLHDLSVVRPSASPIPKPLPQQSIPPEPQPTATIYEPTPAKELAAAPLSVPTVAPVAVAIKAPPTVAPSPAPTARATAQPSPKPPAPTLAPSAKPATPAPVAPSAAPTAAPSSAAVAVRASTAPAFSPAPAAHASLPPANRAGVPSPSPTTAAATAKTAGTAPSPGPKGLGSPGPAPGAGKQAAAPSRPIAVPPTASPQPAATHSPSPAAISLNDRLRGLLPNGPVTPNTKSYAPHLSLSGQMDPTPPPEILAQTKFIYKSRGGSEALVMWVTSEHKSGMTTVCTGWLVRYPLNQAASHPGDFAPANGAQVSIGGGHAAGVLPPIVEGVVTEPCEGRMLVPYSGSPASPP